MDLRLNYQLLEMEMKTVRYHYLFIGMTGIKKIIVSIGKDMDQLEFSYIARRDAKWYSYLDK